MSLLASGKVWMQNRWGGKLCMRLIAEVIRISHDKYSRFRESHFFWDTLWIHIRFRINTKIYTLLECEPCICLPCLVDIIHYRLPTIAAILFYWIRMKVTVVQQLTCLTLGRPNGPTYSTGELLNTPLLSNQPRDHTELCYWRTAVVSKQLTKNNYIFSYRRGAVNVSE